MLYTYTSFLSPSTVKGYKAVYNNDKTYGIKTYFGKCQIKRIKSRDIQNYINFLSKEVSAKSVRNYLILLKNIFSLAVNESIIQREANPMNGRLVLPKKETKPIEAYNFDEFCKLLQLSHEDPNPNIELIINLGLLSGIRRGEMAGLKWENVNFDESYINIVENRIVVKGKEYVKDPKTNCGIRKIYIPERLILLLKQRYKKYLTDKLKMGKHFANSDYVLSKENGKPYSPQGITNCYVRFLERHSDEIRYLKFHGLRHTYASILIEQGENPKTVQHNLGHADVSLTLQIYSHTYESAQKNAAKKLDESLLNVKLTG